MLPLRLGTTWLCHMGLGKSGDLFLTRLSLHVPMVCPSGVLGLLACPHAQCDQDGHQFIAAPNINAFLLVL